MQNVRNELQDFWHCESPGKGSLVHVVCVGGRHVSVKGEQFGRRFTRPIYRQRAHPNPATFGAGSFPRASRAEFASTISLVGTIALA